MVQIPAPERSGRFPTRHPVGAGGPHIPLGAAAASGDATSRHSAASGITLVPADGPGHGEAAADAVRTPYHPELPPHSLSHIVEEVLRGSRGAAVAGAHVDTGVQLSTFADTGDIGARPRTKGRRESLVSRPGVAGLHQHSRPAVSQKPPRTQDAVLVLHSDGLPSRRRYPEDSALDRPAPAMTAAVVLRDTLSPANPVRDDTTLAVAAAGSPDPREQR
ncbi:hypothetical protein [Streptomyces sp. NPDC012825]|uniref:hypothetical protein n=1 Tax=Streptomyces sp. NPDC012825 TaxID=3364851 RepID=UPI00367CE761